MEENGIHQDQDVHVCGIYMVENTPSFDMISL
jgi:hypothetical protein